jgi:hypothetical protein
LSQPEVTAIVQGFDKNDALFGSGIKIGGQKYFTIRADDKVIQGRKVRPPLLPLFPHCITVLLEILTGMVCREKKGLFVLELNRLFLWLITLLDNKPAKSPKSFFH